MKVQWLKKRTYEREQYTKRTDGPIGRALGTPVIPKLSQKSEEGDSWDCERVEHRRKTIPGCVCEKLPRSKKRRERSERVQR